MALGRWVSPRDGGVGRECIKGACDEGEGGPVVKAKRMAQWARRLMSGALEGGGVSG